MQITSSLLVQKYEQVQHIYWVHCRFLICTATPHNVQQAGNFVICFLNNADSVLTRAMDNKQLFILQYDMWKYCLKFYFDNKTT